MRGFRVAIPLIRCAQGSKHRVSWHNGADVLRTYGPSAVATEVFGKPPLELKEKRNGPGIYPPRNSGGQNRSGAGLRRSWSQELLSHRTQPLAFRSDRASRMHQPG